MLLALLTLAMDLHPSNIPVHFEPNQGQVAGPTEWTARAKGGSLYIKGSGIAFETREPCKKPRIMRFVNANPNQGQGLEPTGGYSNYFDGRGEKNWRSGIPHYGKVRYSSLYKGIDLVYYATTNGQIEYDLEAQPGADLHQIELAFEGFNKIAVTPDGDLTLDSITQHRPKVFQSGQEIACTYKLSKANRVTLDVALYDDALPLTVDPVLEFSTYFGGPGSDSLLGLAVDSAGNVVVAGASETPSNPTLDPFQQTNTIVSSAFIAKLTPNADKLLFYTTIRSSSYSSAHGLSLDSRGNAVIYGQTASGDFPLKNAFLSTITTVFQTGFLTKFTADGKSIIHSSYYGGSGSSDSPDGGVVAADDGLIFNGTTSSHDIPIKNALQPRYGGGVWDCFVAKVDSLGSLVFSTYFGGSGAEYCGPIALGPGGSIYFGDATFSDDLPLKDPIQSTPTPVAGNSTPFLARLSPDGSKLEYATLLGGGSPGGIGSIALNSKGEIYLGGFAYPQVPFPTTPNAFQDRCDVLSCPTVIKLDPTGKKILVATYLGRSPAYSSVFVGPDDSVYIAGQTASADFPSLNSLFPYIQGTGVTPGDGFVMKFLGDLRTLVYSTFLGPSSVIYRLAFDAAGRVYGGGSTTWPAFPVKNAFQKTIGGGRDIVLVRLSDTSVAVASPLTAAPGQLQFKYVQGGAPVQSQTVQVTSTDAPVSFTASANASWLTVLPQAATTPVAVQVGAAQLVPGNYSAVITLAPTSGAPLSIPVTLKILLPAPVLTSVEPSFVALGSDDTVITFHGSGFTPDTQLLLAGGPWGSPVTFVDSQTLTTTMSYLSFTSEASYPFAAVNPQSDISNTVTVSIGRLTPVINGVVNVASQLAGPIASGELIQISGTNFGPPAQLTVLVGGILATIVSSSDTQALVIVPLQVQPGVNTSVVLTSGALNSIPATLPVAAVAPAIFTADQSGVAQALINGTASPGATITLFGTGIADLTLPITANINGEDAPVASVSAVDGMPGWFQVTVTIPADVPVDTPVSVAISVNGTTSQDGVTLALTQPQ